MNLRVHTRYITMSYVNDTINLPCVTNPCFQVNVLQTIRSPLQQNPETRGH